MSNSYKIEKIISIAMPQLELFEGETFNFVKDVVIKPNKNAPPFKIPRLKLRYNKYHKFPYIKISNFLKDQQEPEPEDEQIPRQSPITQARL